MSAVALLSLPVMVALFVLTLRPVQVSVNGVTDTVYTHRRTLDGLLLDLDIALQPQDKLLPPAETPVTAGLRVTVARAQPFHLLADGRDVQAASWGKTAEQVLTEAGIAVDRADNVVVDGQPMAVTDPLPPAVVTVLPKTYDRGHAWQNVVTTPRQIRLYRSVPLTVVDGGLPFTLRTTAETVGAALRDAEITLYLGDRVQPSLGSAVSTGMRISIDRSTPLTLAVDGKVTKTRSRGRTVADVLADLKIGLAGLDVVTPPLETPLNEQIDINVTRVHEDIEVTEAIAGFETIFEPDGGLPIDTQQVVSPGAEGITRTRTRLRFEDGQEVAQTDEDTWVAQEPARRVIAYGTQIAPQTATMADGQVITYWRKIRMLASSYSVGTSGTSPSEPWYGKTYTGDPMRFGVVVVDPRIVPLRSQVYVPGYGVGDALDIGSAIRSRRIDLGYDDDNLVLWSRWVEVYLLWPPPPDFAITWVVPNWPPAPN